jgi:hypothetical protein
MSEQSSERFNRARADGLEIHSLAHVVKNLDGDADPHPMDKLRIFVNGLNDAYKDDPDYLRTVYGQEKTPDFEPSLPELELVDNGKQTYLEVFTAKEEADARTQAKKEFPHDMVRQEDERRRILDKEWLPDLKKQGLKPAANDGQ